MGYYSANNLFRLFDITSNTFIKKRDVVFHKCVLGHQGFANNRLPIGLDILGTPVVSPSDSFEDVVNITPPDQLVVNYLGIHPNLDYLGVHQSLYPESVNLESVNLTSHSRPSSGYLRPIFAPVPKTLSATLASPDGEKWKNVMIVEINALERNHTWDVVPPPTGKSTLGYKWVFALRPDSSGNLTRFKARLVARGDLQLDHEFHETFALVAKFCSLKILLSIDAFYNLEIDQGDFDSAFVNGSLDEEIYMAQPPGFTSGDAQHVLRLRKSLYGLKQAARIWYQTLDSLLKQFQF